MRQTINIYCCACLAFCLLCFFYAAAAVCCDDDEIVGITATDDAYIYDGSPDTNYQNKPEGNYLRTGDRWGTGNICRSYIKFNLKSFVSYHINTATLKLYALNKCPGNCYVGVHEAYTDWNEKTITYSNQPVHWADPLDTKYINAAGDTYDYYKWDVTYAARNTQTDDGYLSLQVRTSIEEDPNYWADFASKESLNEGPILFIDHANCPFSGHTYTKAPPHLPVSGASVSISCSNNGYSDPTTTDTQGYYRQLLYVACGCPGKDVTISAQKYVMGVLTMADTTTVKAVYYNLDNVVDLFLKPTMTTTCPTLNFSLSPAQMPKPNVPTTTPAQGYVNNGGSQISTSGVFATFSFNPGNLTCVSVQPIPPFNQPLDYSINNQTGNLTVRANTGGVYIPLGGPDNPTHFFTVTWSVPQLPPQCQYTFVTVENCEFTRQADIINPLPSRTGYLLGSKVVVVDPNGGENLKAGSTYPVRWETDPSIQDVNMQYSDNNGLTWHNIDIVANTHSYSWVVPEVNSHNCLVRISDAANPQVNNTSNNQFSITHCSALLTADLNGDCLVDLEDFAIFAGQWLTDGH